MSKHNSKQSKHIIKPSVRDPNPIVKLPAHQVNPRLLANGFAAVKECRLGLMMYNVNDLIGGRGLELYGEAKWSDLELLGQLLRDGDVVVDVGANIGNHTVFYAKKVSPGGVVYALEPQRITFEFLCANLVLNGLTNVVPMQVGAGEAEGQLIVAVTDPNVVQNFGALKIEGHTSGDLVKIITLDTLELRRCNLIKIDVEGMELQVLQGAEKTIRTCRPFLFVENNDLEGSPKTVQKLLDLGYKCWWQIAPHYNPNNYFHNKENVWANVMPDSNMLCVPEENNLNVSGFEPVINPSDNWGSALRRRGLIAGN
jgi:FkbM family methyltransferase